MVPVDRPGHRAGDARRLYQLGLGLAWAATAMGVLVLIGYLVRSERIVELSPSLPPMYPNAALSLAAGGLAVVGANREGTARILAGAGAVLVLGIGVVGLVLNLTRAPRTWYELLFPADFVAATTPVGGRPVAETCLALILIGVSLTALIGRRSPLVAQGMAVSATAIGLSAVVGFVFGVDRRGLGATVVYVGMALHTGIGLFVLGAALILIRPGVGVVAQLLDGGLSGSITRRLTAGIAGAPLALVVLGVILSGIAPTEELAQSIFSVLQVALLAALVLVPSTVISRTERELREELDTARRRVESGTDIDPMVEAITAEMAIVDPRVPGWDVAMRYEPAQGQLAGDSVQVIHRAGPDPSTLLVVFDIAGHGAHSAVMAYGLRTHIAALWERGADPAAIAASANVKLARRQTNATAVILRFADHGRLVEAVNAGHPPPLHLRAGRLSRWTLTGPLLGFPGPRHTVERHELIQDDLLVLCTDGLHESRSPAGEELGEDRLTGLLLRLRDEPVQDIADACIDLALDHCQGRLRDDALVVVLRRVGAE